MKKLVVVVILLGAGGYLYWSQWGKPERRACSKLAELCGPGGKTGDAQQCAHDVSALGSEAAAKLADCTAKAQSCPEATGCLVGAGMKGIGDAMSDFMKGMGKVLSK